jgi:spore coat polysaccharide biosynthesis predicted glycosyltransferase SpsG
MANSNRGIFFRVDGGRSMGMGHVVRCLWLASALRDTSGSPVTFCMAQDDIGISFMQSRGWPVVRVASEELGEVEGYALIIIVDLPGGLSAEDVRALRQRNPRSLLVLMHGTCTGRIEADLIVSPIERLPDPSSWRGFRGQRYEGPAYAILDPAFARVPRRSSSLVRASLVREPRILVSMGGSDPCGLTLQALRALDIMSEPFHVAVALGPAFLHEEELRTWLAGARRQYECRREDSLLDLMVNCDVALVSFGTTVYELAAAGLPAIALSITEDHAESAEVFAQGGSLRHLGLFSSISATKIQAAVLDLINNQQLRLGMAQRGQALVDGKGAERVAKLLLATIHDHGISRPEGGIGTTQRA